MNLIFSAVMEVTSAVLNIQELYLHLLCFFIHYLRSTYKQNQGLVNIPGVRTVISTPQFVL